MLNPMKCLGRHEALALFLCFISVSSSFAAQPDIVVDGTQDIWLVGQHMFVLEDESLALTIKDVSREELAHRFIRSSTAEPTYGYSQSAYWVRFSYLAKELPPGQYGLLALRNAALEHVDVYSQRPDGSLGVRRGGALVPFAEREVAHRLPAFHLPDVPAVHISTLIPTLTQGATGRFDGPLDVGWVNLDNEGDQGFTPTVVTLNATTLLITGGYSYDHNTIGSGSGSIRLGITLTGAITCQASMTWDSTFFNPPVNVSTTGTWYVPSGIDFPAIQINLDDGNSFLLSAFNESILWYQGIEIAFANLQRVIFENMSGTTGRLTGPTVYRLRGGPRAT